MNLKRKLLAVVASSALVCSSAFAEGFYAKVGAAGTMSMKPEMFTSGETNIVPNLYVGFGMNVVGGFRIGVEGSGWMPATKVAEKVGKNSKELHLKDTWSIAGVAYYDIEVSDSIVPCVGVRVGYVKGAYGLNETSVVDEKVKAGLLKYASFSPLTGGASLGLGVRMMDNMLLDVSYNLDYYSLVVTDEGKAMPKTSKGTSEFGSDDASVNFFAHKVAAGITFKF